MVSKLQFHDHPNSRIGQDEIPIPNSLPEYRHPNEPLWNLQCKVHVVVLKKQIDFWLSTSAYL
jgi:hypothetical protein